ncbi:protoporphyrinogen oxidase [Pseudarthrobacter sulfonivorans]|uniref:Coproporphyrinogen III oxidase n=1 Tax=Pseudarthrobacter sulfonivorans TaxID=121292 RepID=A0A0U3P0Y3_9MICC|nr:protoporphyrinogen oxidase [Pseudarthrobacter sulfonivorans]ALV42799.1 protoporphyrinogen oxidase [Pseudarthrobacter sulfonivorans]
MGSSVTPAQTAVVLGGGISGLLAARELAAAGRAVTVLEATASWGGCVGSHVVAGLTLDSGAESFATRSNAVADLAAELGLGGNVVAPRPGGAWVQLPDGPRELPKTGVLGIPANPWDPEVRRSLGFAGSLRASLDKYLPASIGASADVTSVAALVRARMGRRVLDRLVAPVVGGVHSADPGLLDVDMVAPGLRAGIREHGSLAGAVAAQRRGSTQPSVAKAGSAVAGLKGGMHTLVSALLSDLRGRGVTLMSGTAADAVERTPDGWRVTAGDATHDGGMLVVALPGPAAVGLLQAAVPALAGRSPESGPDVRLVTVVVDLPELDRRPRGTGILVAPQTPGVQAKALTHATAKWDWLAAAAGPGTHVLRLSYGRLEASEPATPETGGSAPALDAELLAAALHDASALLDVPVQGTDVVGWDVVRWQGALPFAAVGHKARVAEVRKLCAAEAGLGIVGGWVAGNGLAAVVADTRKEIRSLLS